MSECQKMRMATMPAHQSGAALLVSLIILLILSIIGISAMRGGLLQTLISSNSQQAEMAFSAADAGVSAVVYTVIQEGTGAGGKLADATAAAGAVTSYSVDTLGAVVAADPDLHFDDDGVRTTPITTIATDLAWEGCVPKCEGNSIKLGSGAGCHTFEINSVAAVAGTQTQVDQWVKTVAAACID